jgi:hypothetical protein
MVLMQPYLKLDGENEPFKWMPDGVADQIAAIKRTLEISNGQMNGFEGHAHFTVFPEYSIPGVDGVNTINAFIENEGCKKGRIVIGCVDGLTKDEFFVLKELPNTVVHENTLSKLSDDHWVNCVIIWCKDLEGHVQKWVQSKLVPARLEKTTECKAM